LKAKWG